MRRGLLARLSGPAKSRGQRRAVAVIATLSAAFIGLVATSQAHAFCGFYVSGADASLGNDASMVVLMREGTRTVLSMQNNYQGPAEDFAMVVPVPVVLKKEEVKTLSKDLFARVDAMAAPRLVEYWERNPCLPDEAYMKTKFFDFDDMPISGELSKPDGAAVGFVEVRATFVVGEYDIAILESNDATTLDKWLRAEKYHLPEGAEAVLKPYIENGMYFFVAKVNANKVKFKDGKAELSPLRFHYESKDFSLPVRLGLLNANGPQDLLVHILARNQRYEVANRKNVTIPTNIDVTPETKYAFGDFYAQLFDKTLTKNPGAVVTEYAWDASTCDPCPGPTLSRQDLKGLGADLIKGGANGLVLTRLHTRYTKDQLKEDLVFKAAAPIEGGREDFEKLEDIRTTSSASGTNNFQGRYAVRHAWEGPITCDEPVRGRWGGPPSGLKVAPKSALKIGVQARGNKTLGSIVRSNIPSLGVTAKRTTIAALGGKAPTVPGAPAKADAVDPDDDGGYGCSTLRPGPAPLGLTLTALGSLAFVFFARRRKENE